MDNREIFSINQLLEVLDPERDVYFKSIIQGLTDDYIVIGMPMYKQQHLNLPKGTVWDFRLPLKDSHYYFRSQSMGRKKEGHILLFLVAWPAELRRVQRRQYYRFPCSFNIHYWVLTERLNMPLEKMAEQLGEPVTAIIADISGGGVQLVSPKRLAAGDILLLALYLESKKKKKTIFVKGKVVWVGPIRPPQATHFRHAVEFQDIPDPLREEIVKFIFVLMRERVV